MVSRVGKYFFLLAENHDVKRAHKDTIIYERKYVNYSIEGQSESALIIEGLRGYKGPFCFGGSSLAVYAE